jgi:hypothetical protein
VKVARMTDMSLGNTRHATIFITVNSKMSIKGIGRDFTFTNEVLVAFIQKQYFCNKLKAKFGLASLSDKFTIT